MTTTTRSDEREGGPAGSATGSFRPTSNLIDRAPASEKIVPRRTETQAVGPLACLIALLEITSDERIRHSPKPFG